MHHFQAVVFDSKIYVVGAMTGPYPKEPPLSHVYIYDPAADAWSQGPEVPVDRRRGGAGAVLYNGEIFLVAGITNGHYDGHVAWTDAFNPRTGQWRQLRGRAAPARSLSRRDHRRQDLRRLRPAKLGRDGADVPVDGP